MALRREDGYCVETDLGSFLRGERLRLGWSLERLAAETGLRWQYIAKIERGDIHTPGDDKLRRIAGALSIPWAEIRRQQGWVIGEHYRSAAEEGVAVQYPRVRRLDVEREGVETVPVLPEWLDGREPSQCFVLRAVDDLIDGGILTGHLVLFERLDGRMPAIGDVVAAQTNEHVWWMFIWTDQMDVEPLGRKLRAWG